MEEITVKRIDHLGLVAGVIQDLGLVHKIDILLPGEHKVSTGNAVAAMILNGLGFTDRPLSLTAEFFEEIAVSRLIGEGVSHVDLNRHRLGRCLDDVAEFGVSKLFAEVAADVAVQEGVSTDRFHRRVACNCKFASALPERKRRLFFVINSYFCTL